MKTWYLLLNFFFVLSLSAQNTVNESSDVENESLKHEISLGFTNLFKQNSGFLEYLWLYEYGDDMIFFMESYPYLNDWTGVTKYGIGYKYHLENSAFRTYFDFGTQTRNYEKKYPDNSIYNSSQTELNSKTSYLVLSGRLGYEFIMKFRKTDLFFGPDFLYRYTNCSYDYNRTTQYYNQYNQLTSTSISIEKEKFDMNEYGGGIFLGLRFYISEMISLSTETRIDTYSYNIKGVYESSSVQGSTSQSSKQESKTSGINSKITPLGVISLNVHF